MVRRTVAEIRAINHQRTADNGGIAPVPQHNASTRYYWGCTCATCVAAARKRHRERPPKPRSKTRAEYLARLARTAANGGVAPTEVHNAHTYNNWGCRCGPCTADHLAKMRRYRSGKRGA